MIDTSIEQLVDVLEDAVEVDGDRTLAIGCLECLGQQVVDHADPPSRRVLHPLEHLDEVLGDLRVRRDELGEAGERAEW